MRQLQDTVWYSQEDWSRSLVDNLEAKPDGAVPGTSRQESQEGEGPIEPVIHSSSNSQAGRDNWQGASSASDSSRGSRHQEHHGGGRRDWGRGSYQGRRQEQHGRGRRDHSRSRSRSPGGGNSNVKMRRMLDDQAAEAARQQRRDYEAQAQIQSRGAGADASAGNQAAVKTYSAAGSGWGEARRQDEEPLVKGMPSWAPPVAHLPAPVGAPDEATPGVLEQHDGCSTGGDGEWQLRRPGVN